MLTEHNNNGEREQKALPSQEEPSLLDSRGEAVKWRCAVGGGFGREENEERERERTSDF